MTHPVHHAQTSVKRWGGVASDYVAIHEWLDASKVAFCDFRHRALRHHSFGVFEAERVFGRTITNTDGRAVPVRYIAEEHIKEDCGGIVPTLADWLSRLPREGWMSRGYTETVEDPRRARGEVPGASHAPNA
ncbi:DUF6915 family protein [Solimonas flava]|uniref:DUF6915 family protein n=1 Tax=Solimonas flava TaxID=415849 RepID=UPI0006851BC2|nr:hypothetical protein [Solimonas flava]